MGFENNKETEGWERVMSVYIGIIVIIMIITFSMPWQDSKSVLIEQKGMGLTYYKLQLFFISAILIFFAGVRYEVGADYKQYAENFQAYCTQELVWNKEPGIRFVAQIASKISDNYGMMFFLMSVITVGLAVYTIAKESDYYRISILLYIFLGSWHETFNSVRQSAAASILFWGHRYIKERKLIKWLLVCMVAFLFHTSAIIFVPLYFVPQKKVTIKNIAILIMVGIVAGLSYDRAFEFVGLLQGKEYIMDAYSVGHISIFRIIVAWVPVLFYFLQFYRTQSSNDEKDGLNFYAMMSALSGAIILAARYSTYLGRIVIYTDIYNALFWACMMRRFPKEDRNTKVWIVLIMGCYFIYYLNEASGQYLVNYQWIFGK